MRANFALALPFALFGCGPGEDQETAAVMNGIERQVQLPAGAQPVDSYARYYAMDYTGRVIAEYTTHVDWSNRQADLPIGHRRWLHDYGMLPGISGGGCRVVNIVYLPKEHRVASAVCNGTALRS
jgi:hypothetical protein